MEISEEEFTEYFVDHKKMEIMREVAKKMPGSDLLHIITCIDEKWTKEIKKLKPPKKKKKSNFVTKF